MEKIHCKQPTHSNLDQTKCFTSNPILHFISAKHMPSNNDIHKRDRRKNEKVCLAVDSVCVLCESDVYYEFNNNKKEIQNFPIFCCLSDDKNGIFQLKQHKFKIN